jgi:hypothetical protein
MGTGRRQATPGNGRSRKERHADSATAQTNRHRCSRALEYTQDLPSQSKAIKEIKPGVRPGREFGRRGRLPEGTEAKATKKLAKKRRGRFSLEEDRQLIQMAATSATLEEAAAIFRTSVDTIEKKSKRLGIQLRRRRSKGLSAG